MEEISDFLMIPLDRIGAIIGKKGTTKRDIEEKTETKIHIDSKDGEIEVIQKGSPLKYLKAMAIIRSIGRGFSPERAFKLLDDGNRLEIIDIREIIGGNQSAMKAKKGRVIGSHGKAREEIEKETGAKISVYGKTIGIIGNDDQIEKARKAIEMLLGGASHDMAYDYLKKDFNREKFEL